MKISGIYKITNVETNEFYIGSSVNIKSRWIDHKCSSSWKRQPNNKLYIDFQQYGLDKFSFEILEKTDNLKEREQYYIDLLKPIYNNYRAKDHDIERYKEYKKEYNNQLCNYNGEIITLCALRQRFSKKGIEHPVLEAKKYLIEQIE